MAVAAWSLANISCELLLAQCMCSPRDVTHDQCKCEHGMTDRKCRGLDMADLHQ